MWQWIVVVVAAALFLLAVAWFVARVLRVTPLPAAAGAAPLPAASASAVAPVVPAVAVAALATAPVAASEPVGAQTPAAAPVHDDDLTVVEGIGPKLSDVLRAAGIRTFAQLAGMSVDELRRIIASAGSRFALADPATWPEQAALAASGDLDGLKALQDGLSAGRRS